jgi:hypothetical protein
LAEEVGAKGGIGVTLTLKPGLPLGPFSQKIRLQLDRPGAEEFEVSLHGRVVGDITFIGQGYDGERGILSLGTIASETGASRTVHVMVKGPNRHKMKLSIRQIAPEGELQAALGEPRELNDGAVIMVPLELKVPPGAPPADHLGHMPGSMGRIELDTNVPNGEKVNLYVSFLVEKSR